MRRAAAGDRRGGRPAAGDDDAVPLGGRETQRTRDGDFLVRSVPGAAAGKPYRCPGCQQVIGIGTAHLVVWPADDRSWVETAVDARRHWHRSCWHRRATRGTVNPG